MSKFIFVFILLIFIFINLSSCSPPGQDNITEEEAKRKMKERKEEELKKLRTNREVYYAEVEKRGKEEREKRAKNPYSPTIKIQD
uniref:Uncharacterized protein n=1 Tax=Meloidogyne enterolobii TaxID=390850 RepID=A0A6V7Y2Z2_MELEN|nr:unnamed protein product [Meloidogyne enterolobii]